MTDHEGRPDDREIDALVRQEDREAAALGDDCDELRRQLAEFRAECYAAKTRLRVMEMKLLRSGAMLGLAREAFDRQCRDYCEWYDHGKAGYDAPGIAYHLTTLARRAIAGLDGTEDPSA